MGDSVEGTVNVSRRRIYTVTIIGCFTNEVATLNLLSFRPSLSPVSVLTLFQFPLKLCHQSKVFDRACMREMGRFGLQSSGSLLGLPGGTMTSLSMSRGILPVRRIRVNSVAIGSSRQG